MKTIYVCITIFGIAIIGGIITKYFAYHYEGYCGCYMAAKERLQIGDHLRHVPMSFFKKNSLGDIAIAVTSDIKYIEANAPVLLEGIINGLVSSVIFLMFFNIKIGTIFALTFVIALILIQIVEKAGNDEVLKQKETLSKATNSTIEYIRGIATFKMHKMMGKNTAKIKELYNEYSNACEKSEYKLIPLVSLLFGIIKIAQSVIMIVSAVMFLNNELPLLIAAMMIVASFSFFNPLESVALASAMIRTMKNTIERVKKVKDFNLIDEDGQEVTLDKYDIEIKNVSFSYDDNYKENDEQENTTIRDVSFKVKSNSMTAIVCEIFDWIWVVWHYIILKTPELFPFEEPGVIRMNYCISGRCELDYKNKKVFYVGAGDFVAALITDRVKKIKKRLKLKLVIKMLVNFQKLFQILWE